MTKCGEAFLARRPKTREPASRSKLKLPPWGRCNRGLIVSGSSGLTLGASSATDSGLRSSARHKNWRTMVLRRGFLW